MNRLMTFGLLLLINFIFVRVSAKTIVVSQSGKTSSIRQALSLAGHGDTILVKKGVYKEHDLQINRRIYVIGEDFPVIDGDSKGTILQIHATGVVIEGLKIINTGISQRTDIAGILVVDSYNATIRGNQLENTQFAIYLQHSVGCTIKDNIIRSNTNNEVLSGNGIHAWRSDSLIISGNKITGHRDGLYFEFVTNTLVWRNSSTKNFRYGIHFMFSHDNTYIANVFEGNGSGIAVMYSKRVHMLNNHFLNNWGGAAYGILLKEITDSEISGNRFIYNTTALEMEDCNRINIHKNTFKNNGWAINISSSSMDNMIFRNNFINNTFDVSTSGSTVMNNFDGNYWDKYEGYDLNKNGTGDLPYHPISMYSMVIHNNPAALMLFRSIIVSLLDKTEKLLPGITPEKLKDNKPLMKPLSL